MNSFVPVFIFVVGVALEAKAIPLLAQAQENNVADTVPYDNAGSGSGSLSSKFEDLTQQLTSGFSNNPILGSTNKLLNQVAHQSGSLSSVSDLVKAHQNVPTALTNTASSTLDTVTPQDLNVLKKFGLTNFLRKQPQQSSDYPAAGNTLLQSNPIQNQLQSVSYPSALPVSTSPPLIQLQCLAIQPQVPQVPQVQQQYQGFGFA